MKRIVKKKILFFFVCFCVSLVPLHANYFLTEAELVRLEKISEELGESNSQLEAQQNSLKATVTALKKVLNEKEILLKNLETSFDTFESEVMAYQNKQRKKIEDLTQELNRVKKWRRVWCLLACGLGVFVVMFFSTKILAKRFL